LTDSKNLGLYYRKNLASKNLKVKISKSKDFDNGEILYFYWKNQKFPPHNHKSIFNSIIWLVNKIAKLFHKKIKEIEDPDWEPVFFIKYDGIKDADGKIVRGDYTFYTRFHYHILCIWSCPLKMHNGKPIIHFVNGSHTPVIIPDDKSWYSMNDSKHPPILKFKGDKKVVNINKGKCRAFELSLIRKFEELILKFSPNPAKLKSKRIKDEFEEVQLEVNEKAIFDMKNIYQIVFIGHQPTSPELPSCVHKLIHGIRKKC